MQFQMEVGEAADVRISLVMQTVYDATFKRIVTYVVKRLIILDSRKRIISEDIMWQWWNEKEQLLK